jgi:hypothetical protein
MMGLNNKQFQQDMQNFQVEGIVIKELWNNFYRPTGRKG